ncbi:MAG: hypothetical protein Q8L86_09380 [Vicinamibacterales bacterium]|nr:hypothetical protein [Vicinamibacterales bacterium]
MTRPLAASVVWLIAGAVLIAGLYWTFLYTPESNLSMLAASAMLVVAMLAVASISATGALRAWTGPRGLPSTVVDGLHALPAFVATLLIGALVWWAAARGAAWTVARSGEIAAWFIATFNWADIAPVFRGIRAVTFWVQWVLTPVVALGLFAGWLEAGVRGLIGPSGLGRVLAPRVLALATLWMVLLVALPWQFATRPLTGLPSTWVEPAIVGARLMLVGLVAAIGLALVCGTVTRTLTRQRGA